MVFNLSKVRFSLNDKRRKIVVPRILTEELAEDIGFHLGDGYLGDYSTPSNPHKYELTYSGHAIDEKSYYYNVLNKRKYKLFKIKPRIYIKNNNISARILSKALLTYFRDVLGVICGNKLRGTIPSIIMESQKKIKIAFIRGLFDADGTLTFLKKYKKVHYYPRVSIELISKSIVYSLAKLLKELNIKFCLSSKLTKRNGILCKEQFCININGNKNAIKYIKLIGFSNPKFVTKYKIWKRYGFCPPQKNIEQYKKILTGDLEPYG